MLPYNQLTSKTVSSLASIPRLIFSFQYFTYIKFLCQIQPPEIMVLTSCVRRMSDSIEKRFCFDLQVDSQPGVVYTFQALSESDRKAWLDIMDGKEPVSENVIRIFIKSC